jgi:4-alpha-glucanotransferase
VVAGVPPDIFSNTGQLWGNPLYRWKNHEETEFHWWIARIKASLEQVDILRLDHFRGFAGYWEIKADQLTAEKGVWVKGPGEAFFEKLKNEIWPMPIIAEDLGNITADVINLREKYKLPGMKILQFGFDSPQNPFLPHHYAEFCAAYTGSHDNDTARGWYQKAPEIEKDLIRRYLARSGEDISWDMIRCIWGSTALVAVAPLQDFLNLGSEARMNYPGRLGGNWSWRMDGSALQPDLSSRIREINFLYSRLDKNSQKQEKVKTILYRDIGNKKENFLRI